MASHFHVPTPNTNHQPPNRNRKSNQKDNAMSFLNDFFFVSFCLFFFFLFFSCIFPTGAFFSSVFSRSYSPLFPTGSKICKISRSSSKCTCSAPPSSNAVVFFWGGSLVRSVTGGWEGPGSPSSLSLTGLTGALCRPMEVTGYGPGLANHSFSYYYYYYYYYNPSTRSAPPHPSPLLPES